MGLGGGWVDGGGGGGWVYGGCGWCPKYMCICMGTHTCARVYDIIGNSHGFPQWGGHLHEIIMFTMHAFVCVCMHVCGGHPPSTPIHPPPRAAGSLKHQNSITLELIKIIRFCLKILYL